MGNSYTYLVIGGLIVLAIGIIISRKFKGNLSKDGISVEVDNSTDKDKTSVKDVKNKSSVDVETTKGRNVEIEGIDSSEIKIKK